MRVILHIGQHKTGTTAIQHCLKVHRAFFLAHGFLPPQTGQDQAGSHEPLVRDIAQGDTDGTIVGLRTELSLHPGADLLVSGEQMMNDIAKDRFTRVLEGFRSCGADRFTIVMYLRSPFELVNGLYALNTRTFSMQGLPLAAFAARFGQDQASFLSAYTDYNRIIALSQRGDIDLVLRPYNRTVASSVVADLLQTLALPPLDAADGLRLNTTNGPLALEAMRATARALGKMSVPQRRLVRAEAARISADYPERVSYWGITDKIAARLARVDQETDRLSVFAWGKPWRDAIDDVRKVPNAYDPAAASPDDTAIYNAMVDRMSRAAATLSA